MTIREWATDTKHRVRDDGLAGVRESAYELYVGGLRRANRVYQPDSTNVYERDWDILILLDACRPDLIAEVGDEYPFLDQPSTIQSVGSASLEWLRQTFTDEWSHEIRQTAYVTGNPFSPKVLDPNDVLLLDEVWRYGFDEETGTIPADVITDRAISVAREHDPERLIVHYMQPHFPSIPDPVGGKLERDGLGEGTGWDSPWDQLRRGEISRKRVWESYRENLRYVLDEVSSLLKNVEGDRVVISADHANAIGEWSVYGHPAVPLKVLREVPWYTTSARDERTREPTVERSVERGDVEHKLESLGYL